MPGMGLFGAEERKEVMDVLETGVGCNGKYKSLTIIGLNKNKCIFEI